MKKLLIGAIVGGIIIFAWQTLSWSVMNLHGASQEYTPKQDSILSYLNSQFSEDGSYLVPGIPNGATSEERNKMMEATKGKPWAQIQYHKAMNINMGSNIARGLIVDIIMVAFMCWILLRLSPQSFGTIFTACLFTGVIVFLNSRTLFIYGIQKQISWRIFMMPLSVGEFAAFGWDGTWAGNKKSLQGKEKMNRFISAFGRRAGMNHFSLS